MRSWSRLSDADLLKVAQGVISIISEATREECLRILVRDFVLDNLI